MRLLKFLFSFALLGLTTHAEQSPAPAESSTPPPARNVRISFLPPPLEGTISLGIYDAKGTLMRVLHREADVDDFEIGSDALSTTWDGKNDAGESLPAGKYHARGFVVGEELGVEGVGYFFNDWVADEQSFRVTAMSGIAVESGVLIVTVKLTSGRTLTLACDANGNIVTTGEEHSRPETCKESVLPGLTEPISCDLGKDKTRWVVDRLAQGSPDAEVVQFSATNELLRRLKIPAEEPQPREIAASKDTDTIFLREENAAMQRIRALTLLSAKKEQGQSISDWKVEFAKKIVAHKNFTIENGKPVTNGGKAPAEKISLKLLPNPLQNDAKGSVEVTVGYDASGSFMQTTDGLPLQGISETPHLTRVVFSAKAENSVDVFQDDDAVVEQFRIDHLDQMMAFDCGEIELK